MELLHIAILEGTTRPQRLSLHAAKLVETVGQSLPGVEVKLVDPTMFSFPGDGNDIEGKDPRYTEITVWADAFFIITPEYNHSFPGSLKRMLDSELSNYIHKAVAFGSVSSGRWGGIRAIEALTMAVREMGLVSTFTDVQFPNIAKIFDDQGALLDPIYPELIGRAYTELIWMAKALKNARENLLCDHTDKRSGQ